MYSKVIYAKREVIDEFEKLKKWFSNDVKKLSADANAQLSSFDFKNKLQFDLFNDQADPGHEVQATPFSRKLKAIPSVIPCGLSERKV